MDYMDIILTGITDPNKKKYFADYLFRVFKEADGYSKEEFFSGCRFAYETLQNELIRHYYNLMNLLVLNDDAEKIAFQNAEINLNTFTRQKYSGFLKDADISWIKQKIDEAEQMAMKPDQLKKPHPKFADYLQKIENKEKFISDLKKIFPTGENTEAAQMVIALVENGLMEMPTNISDLIKAIQTEWNSHFQPESFRKPLRQIEHRKTVEKKPYKGEIISAINKVKEISCI